MTPELLERTVREVRIARTTYLFILIYALVQVVAEPSVWHALLALVFVYATLRAQWVLTDLRSEREQVS